MPLEHFHKFGQELVKDNVGINHHVRQNILSRNFFRIVIFVPISENLDAIVVIVQLKGPMSQTVVCAKQELRNGCESVARNLQIKEGEAIDNRVGWTIKTTGRGTILSPPPYQ